MGKISIDDFRLISQLHDLGVIENPQFVLAGVFARVLTVPKWVLVPCIAVLAFVGVFQLHSDLHAIYLMLIIGIFGYLLRKFGFSLAPIVLGFVLGGLMEQNLRRALAISTN